MPVDVSQILAAYQNLGQVNARNRDLAFQAQQRRAGQIGALAGVGVGAGTFMATGNPYAAGLAGQGTSMLVTPAMGGPAPGAADIGQLGLNAYMAQQQQQKQAAAKQTGAAIMGAYGPGPQPIGSPAQAINAPVAPGSPADQGSRLEALVPGAYSAPGQAPPPQGAFGSLAQASTPQYANPQEAGRAQALDALKQAIATGQVDPQTVATVMGAIHPAGQVVQTAPGATTSIYDPRTRTLVPVIQGGPNPMMVRSETMSRGQYDAEIKDYVSTKPYAENMMNIAQKKNPTPADDYSLAFNVQKMLNPQSEISEREAEGFQKIGSFDTRLQAYVGQLASGNRFTDDQRHQIMEIGARHYQGMYNNYSQSRGNFQNIAKTHQWDPDSVAPDRGGVRPDDLNKAVGIMPGAPQAAPPAPKLGHPAAVYSQEKPFFTTGQPGEISTTSKADYDKLPRRAWYVKDGQLYQKR